MLFEELGALLQELLARDVAFTADTRAVPREVPAAIPSVARLDSGGGKYSTAFQFLRKNWSHRYLQGRVPHLVATLGLVDVDFRSSPLL